VDIYAECCSCGDVAPTTPLLPRRTLLGGAAAESSTPIPPIDAGHIRLAARVCIVGIFFLGALLLALSLVLGPSASLLLECVLIGVGGCLVLLSLLGWWALRSARQFLLQLFCVLLGVAILTEFALCFLVRTEALRLSSVGFWLIGAVAFIVQGAAVATNWRYQSSFLLPRRRDSSSDSPFSYAYV
jgi:hypothetical protein